MKHATQENLDRLEPLLHSIRALDGLTEKKRGVFYWKSKAFLHFHEHDDVMYADVRLGAGDFDRLRLASPAEQRHLVSAIRTRLAILQSSSKAGARFHVMIRARSMPDK